MSGSNPTLQATINQFISDADLAHQFVNGPADAYVTTPNGQFPTLANIAAASQAALLAASVVTQLEFTAQPDAWQVMDSFGLNIIRSARYDITIFGGTGYQYSSVLLIQDGQNVTIMEYGRINTNVDQADFDAAIDNVNGVAQLLILPIGAGSTVVKAVRTVVPA